MVSRMLETGVVPEHSVLYVSSDGTYEIEQADGTIRPFEAFTDFLARATAEGKSEIEDLSDFVHQMHGKGPLEDDFSIIKFQF